MSTNTSTLTPAQQRLNDLWEEHVRDEFVERDTEATLATMVTDAYVNHVPVMTGGVGREGLREFYARRFIPQMPPDTEILPVSRTIGNDRVVDEMRNWATAVEHTFCAAPCGTRCVVDFTGVCARRGTFSMHDVTSAAWRSLDLFAPSEEHKLLAQTLADFVRNEVEPQAERYNREEKFNRGLFQRAGDLGFLGLTIPEDEGGAGLDAVASVMVHEALSTADPGFALAYLAHSILFVNNFYRNASGALRARILPRVISGEWIGGMCMTEPEAGTDVLGMRSRARRNGDHYVLDGRKTFITNGAIDDQTLGDVFLVYAKTDERSISTFIVERGFSGFSLGQRLKDKLGMRASMTAELLFDQCVVPVSNRLGEEGESALHMMRNLEIERLSLSAMGLGIALRCVQVMVDYASQRKAFGVPILEHGQIQRHIAESYAELKAARCYVYDTARRLDLSSHGNRVDADGTKLFSARIAKEIADRAIQVLGGYGYMGEYVVERLWRDAKLLEIGGGTMEAHQKNIVKDLARSPELIWR